MLEFIRQVPQGQLINYFYSDMTDFYLDVVPGVIWEELNNFNCDYYESKLDLFKDSSNQFILIT